MREFTRGVRATFLALPTVTWREDRESWGCTMKGQEAEATFQQWKLTLDFRKFIFPSAQEQKFSK